MWLSVTHVKFLGQKLSTKTQELANTLTEILEYNNWGFYLS